jgi:hypothetical protein
MGCSATLLALGLLAAACGSDTDVDANQIDAEPTPVPSVPPEPVPTAEPTLAPTATVVPEPTAAPATPVRPREAPALESNYNRPPRRGGWSVAAGDWISHSFSPPLFFSLPIDGTVINEGSGRLEIAVGDPQAPAGFLTIVEPLAINSPTGPIPIDVADPATVFAGYDLRDQGSIEVDGRTIDSYDAAFPDDPALARFRTPCDRSPGYECLTPFTTLSNLVFLEEQVLHRFVAQDWGDGRLIVVASPVASNDDPAFLEYADVIARSAVGAPASVHRGVRWLTTLGDRAGAIPAGSYVGRVGDTTIAVDLELDLDSTRVHAQRSTVLGVTSWVDEDWGSGQVRLFDFDDFLDPETGTPRSDRRDDAMPTAEFEAGLAELLIVERTGTDVLGGIDAAWYDVTAELGIGESCATSLGWSNPDATCVAWASMLNPYRILQPSDVVSRVYYLETVDLVVVVTPQPGFTVDDVLGDLSLMVDGLQILGWPT